MSDRAIIESIRKIADRHRADDVTYANAIVNSVDLPNRMCSVTVTSGNAENTINAKLMAVVDDGLLIEPVIGSTVKVIFSVNLEAFVCQYSEIENITIDALTKIKLNDGRFGGVVKVDGVVDYLKKVYADIAQIAVSLNTLGYPITQQTAMPDKGDFENTKIIHGI